MLKSFIRGGNLRRWLNRADCPQVILEFKRLFDLSFDATKSRDEEAPGKDGEHAHHTYKGVNYSRASTHLGNSLVIFYPSNSVDAVAGSIQKIEVVDNEVKFFIQRQTPLPSYKFDQSLASPSRAPPIYLLFLCGAEFANVLEQLETEFYAQGIAKFQEADFTGAGFSSSLIASQTLATIQLDEATHTTVIQQALVDNGAEPLKCNFKFGSALDDVATMAATARVVEYVGVAAYLGGATLIDDPIFLDAAASILTVEARHQTVLNIMSGTGSAILVYTRSMQCTPFVLRPQCEWFLVDCECMLTYPHFS